MKLELASGMGRRRCSTESRGRPFSRGLGLLDKNICKPSKSRLVILQHEGIDVDEALVKATGEAEFEDL